MSLDPWLGCEEYAECEWDLELNGCQVLFKCVHGRYWYLGDRLLAQIQHVYPPVTILVPPCPSIRLADLLANEEIARARIGHVVSGTSRNYFDFIQSQLQGCLVGIPATSISLLPSEVKLYFILYAPFPYFHFVTMFVYYTLRLHLLRKRKRKREENPPPSHASGSSSSFMETYPHFLAWQCEVMNPDGLYSSMTLDRPEHTPPKSKKTLYLLLSDAFNLTHWNGEIRLTKSPLLTYRPQDHLSEDARAVLVSFSNFSRFLIFL